MISGRRELFCILLSHTLQPLSLHKPTLSRLRYIPLAFLLLLNPFSSPFFPLCKLTAFGQ